ncbi:hypothetical protein [Flavobacterium sp. NRK F7]|uniref:hypothetical protein n=1 Tax=Flavobacterium sp. NRK F7 TaxID=2954930 RepID=UPI002091A21F|nr:hypothetical protein [Flavobacterium sp. NRK F7]MCO6163267.1 hypothetical protein [Flavobacterium sp. NRK F7]
MKYSIILTLLCVFISSAQTDTTRVVAIERKIDTITVSEYVDFENSYTIQKQNWLKVNSQLPLNMYGGTMPKVNGIENAVMITAFKKNKFKDFNEFEHIYITGNTFGKPALFSNQHTWYGRNERDFKKIKHGVSSRVFYIFKNKVYHNQFVLLETSTAYLFIHFCSTPETYTENIEKFNIFLNGLSIQ